MNVTQAITERHSIRRFLSKDVPSDTIKKILADASRAPSGTNTQPWKVTCVAGGKKHQLSRAISDAIKNDQANLEYRYMPSKLREPYLSRKRKVGYTLYELYGIARDDYPARKQAMLRNFEFFGAPVGLFFRMDRDLLYGSWLDMGMFMQNVMILARAHGLESCPQQAWCEFGSTVHKVLEIPEEEIIISGMSLGYAATAPENTLISERADVDEFAIFLE